MGKKRERGAKLLSILLTVVMLVTSQLPAFAETLGAADIVRGVSLTFGDETYDVYNNPVTLSNDYDATITFSFDFKYEDRHSYCVQLFSETEDGKQTELWRGYKKEKEAKVELSQLPGGSGIRLVVHRMDPGAVLIHDSMLGLIVEEGKNRKLYSGNVEVGPSKGAVVDMDKLSKGMSFSMNPFPIPIVYKRFEDGRSVIGLGWNSTNQQFWEKAKAGEFSNLSFAQMKEAWKKENAKTEYSSLGLVWAVSGYATSYADNPDKMTGTIQFYAGTGAVYSGQYLIFTYSITVTVGVDGSLTFVLKPGTVEEGPLSAVPTDQTIPKDRFQTQLDLTALAGLEVYGGVGVGSLASVGVYGAATFGADMHVYPDFFFREVYVDGEIGLKAKALGRVIASFTLVKDRIDFYKRVEADGTEVWASELDLEDSVSAQMEELADSDYGDKIYDVSEADGPTIWDVSSDLTVPTETEGGLLTGSDGFTVGDAGYAHRIASNVHPDSGIQVEKMKDNKKAIIALVSNNSNRSIGNKGELTYLIYDNDKKEITEPAPVCSDIDGDGIDETGADYDPVMKRNPTNGNICIVWKRGQDVESNRLTLRQAAESNKLCFACYDDTVDSWTDEALLLDDSSDIIGGMAIGYRYLSEDMPRIYMYTNPADDPAGLSAQSQHVMYEFKRDDQGKWNRRQLYTETGRITSFDAGCYYFSSDGKGYEKKEVVAYTIEDTDGNSKVRVAFNWYAYNEENDKAAFLTQNENGLTADNYYREFPGARNGKFASAEGDSALTFTEDGALYFVTGYRNDSKTRVFPMQDGEKISEANFQLIGDIVSGSALMGYLASVDGSQNIRGYVRNRGSATAWYNAEMSDVAANANVSYYGGAFFENDEPMLIYTVMNYIDNGKSDESEESIDDRYIDDTSDLFIQTGDANVHVHVASAEVMNLHDIGADKKPAKVSLYVENNGIQPVTRINVFAKKAEEPDSAYVEAGTFDIDKLYQGQGREIVLELKGDFSEACKYMIGVNGKSDTESDKTIQSSALLDIPEGDIIISESIYSFQGLTNDNYTAVAKSAGPGVKSGTLVFYNTKTNKIYSSVPLGEMKPGEIEAESLVNLKGGLIDKYPNLGVTVLADGESLNEKEPSPNDQEVLMVPSWYLGKSSGIQTPDTQEESKDQQGGQGDQSKSQQGDQTKDNADGKDIGKNLPKPSIKKPVSKKKALIINWKKLSKNNQKKISGFEIQYSTTRKFKKAKIVKAGKSKTSKKIKKLKAKKTYYIRVRTYKKIKGTKYKGKWSGITKARTK